MFRIDKTPRIPEASSNRNNPVHREVHEIGPGRPYNEEKIRETRDEIISKYNIPEDHIIVDLETKDGEQRVIRAFSIIKHSKDTLKVYYAEGHKSHFELFQSIIDKHSAEIGVTSMADLNIDGDWVVKKGFLDPNNNHFKSFPHAQAGLLGIYGQNKKINGGQELANIESLPNWFLSADSEKEEDHIGSDPLG